MYSFGNNIPLIRFDWAIKHILRQKSNFKVLEGFLSELLDEEIIINQILESESNKETESDKYNKVDILAEDKKGERIIIEIQNHKEFGFIHRILYGASKAIVEQLNTGDCYSKIKRVISITIAYFELADGEDYIYRGNNEFRGYNYGDLLKLTPKQQKAYEVQQLSDIFPEYWIIKANVFNEKINTKLDEWIYFFKRGAIQPHFNAKGLQEAAKILDKLSLSHKERRQYEAFEKQQRDHASFEETKMLDFQFEMEDLQNKMKKVTAEKKEGESEKNQIESEKNQIESEKNQIESEKNQIESEKNQIEKDFSTFKTKTILSMYDKGISIETISKTLSLTTEDINKVINT